MICGLNGKQFPDRKEAPYGVPLLLGFMGLNPLRLCITFFRMFCGGALHSCYVCYGYSDCCIFCGDHARGHNCHSHALRLNVCRYCCDVAVPDIFMNKMFANHYMYIFRADMFSAGGCYNVRVVDVICNDLVWQRLHGGFCFS